MLTLSLALLFLVVLGNTRRIDYMLDAWVFARRRRRLDEIAVTNRARDQVRFLVMVGGFRDLPPDTATDLVTHTPKR